MSKHDPPAMDKMTIILSARIPVELTNGNDGRGSKWFKSAKVRQQFEQQFLEWKMQRKPFDFPTIVTVTRILGPGQRLWDSSSIGRGNWKEIEDALVAIGWWHDDGPKWITETRFRQDAAQRSAGPCVDVLVERLRAMPCNEPADEIESVHPTDHE